MLKLIIIACLLISNVCIAAKEFTLNSALLESHQTLRVKNTKAMLAEAIGSLGYELVFNYRPNKRSIVEANNGLVDGEFVRIASIIDEYPNLVVVPESIAKLDIVAFSLRSDIDLTEYKFDQHRYRIGYLRGWKNVENLLENYPYKMAVGEHDVLFKLLAHGRLDLVFFNRTAGEKILRQQQHLNYQISPSQHSYLVYLVVHKKHAALAPKLAKKLKQLKQKYKIK